LRKAEISKKSNWPSLLKSAMGSPAVNAFRKALISKKSRVLSSFISGWQGWSLNATVMVMKLLLGLIVPMTISSALIPSYVDAE